MKKLLVLAIAILSILFVSCEKNECDSPKLKNSYFDFNHPKKSHSLVKSFSKNPGDSITFYDANGIGYFWTTDNYEFVKGFMPDPMDTDTLGAIDMFFDDEEYGSSGYGSTTYNELFNNDNWTFSYWAKITDFNSSDYRALFTMGANLDNRSNDRASGDYILFQYSNKNIQIFLGDGKYSEDYIALHGKETNDSIRIFKPSVEISNIENWNQYTIVKTPSSIQCFMGDTISKQVIKILDMDISVYTKNKNYTKFLISNLQLSGSHAIIDELYIWDIALSETEVLDHLNTFSK